MVMQGQGGPKRLTVASVVTISGRGTVLVGAADGDEFQPGDMITCGQLITQVTGVERPLGRLRPNSPAGLLVRMPKHLACAGQVWEFSHSEGPKNSNLLSLYTGASK